MHHTSVVTMELEPFSFPLAILVQTVRSGSLLGLLQSSHDAGSREAMELSIHDGYLQKESNHFEWGSCTSWGSPERMHP